MSSPQVAEKLQQEVERWRKTLMLLEQADTTQARNYLLANLPDIISHHDRHHEAGLFIPRATFADCVPPDPLLSCFVLQQGASQTIVRFMTEQATSEPFLGTAENNPWSAAAPGGGGCCTIN